MILFEISVLLLKMKPFNCYPKGIFQSLVTIIYTIVMRYNSCCCCFQESVVVPKVIHQHPPLNLTRFWQTYRSYDVREIIKWIKWNIFLIRAVLPDSYFHLHHRHIVHCVQVLCCTVFRMSQNTCYPNPILLWQHNTCT